MDMDEALLNSLYKGRLEDLREVATQHDLPRSGNVEQLRAKLIAILVLGGVDFSDQGIQSIQNRELSELLGIFGVKKSGSKKQKMQRLWLHLNEDPKRINVDKLPDMTREELHALCVSLDLPRSGNKTQLMGRVAGIVSSQDGSWGKIKKSLKKGAKKATAPRTADEPAAPPTPTPPTTAPSTTTEEEPGSDDSGDSVPTLVTLDEGAGEALVRLEARKAELISHLREFLLIGREQDEGDVASFIEDLGRLGFGIQHSVVRERVLGDLQDMIKLKHQEDAARSALPGSWREKQALRGLEEARPELLDILDSILERHKGDVAGSRMAFELAAGEMGLDLELAAISGRVHGLFDLQVSLLASEQEMDPVTARRQRALDILYRGTHDATPEAMGHLSKIETQMEAFERVVETIVRRSDGAFGPAEHALMVRFLERRGWDANHPEVRPRMLAAAGILAAEMGYIAANEIPALPTALSLDPEKVSDVVEAMREVLADMGRTPTSVEDVEREGESKEAEASRVRDKLDAADSLLRRLNRGSSQD